MNPTTGHGCLHDPHSGKIAVRKMYDTSSFYDTAIAQSVLRIIQ